MLCCPIDRERLLAFMPKGGSVAEIGVAFGTFSACIWKSVQPRSLHLIDLWSHQADETYRADPANVADDEQERRYRAVLGMFAQAIAAGGVRVHRTASTQAARRFVDGELDWAYVDARHDHLSVLSVLADLRAWAPKVKDDGLLLGHDFANHPQALSMGFGVVEAVRDFVAESGFHFLAMTSDPWPTYVLARQPQAEPARMLLGRLLYNLPGCVEIADPFATYRQVARMVGDKPVVVPGF
jgi:hypothetical protein